MATTILDAFKRPFDSWALDLFYRGFFEDPILEAFYAGSGYANLGYWDRSTGDAVAACDRLVDRVVEMGGGGAPGRVLDVACGQGATTRRMLRHFDAGRISAINISQAQLEAARDRAPGVTFYRMDATSLQFPDGYFDRVVCIEAAFHFRTRRRFFEEALRVLAPGGSLAVSDLLMTPGAPTVPWGNYLADRQAYRDLLTEVGFEEIRVEEALEPTWRAFKRELTDFIRAKASTHGWAGAARDLVYINVTLAALIRDALLAGARKPG